MNPDAKRAAIMAAGERLFASRGYTGTAMSDIAGEAGVAVGTVYRLFPDKPSLLAALHIDMEDRFIASMRTGWASVEAFALKFEPMINALFDQAESVRETMPLYTLTRDMIGAADYVPGARMISVIDELYREGVTAGSFRAYAPGVQPHIAHAMVEGGLRAWMEEPTNDRRQTVVRDLVKLFHLAFLIGPGE